MNKDISYSQLINIDETDTEYAEYEYCGIPITIKIQPSLTDILQIADDVTEGSFLDDGSYLPELVEFLTVVNLIDYLTNVKLPEDASECYDFVMRSDFGHWLISKLDSHTTSNLIDSINKKLAYATDAGIAALRSKMSELFLALDDFAIRSSELFGDITAEDRARLTSAVNSMGTIDEDKLVKAFLKHDKKNAQKKSTEK